MDITIEEHVGSHREVAWSFREAEDSEELLKRYIDLGRVWVAVDPAGRTIGHLQAVPRDDTWEVTNTAVLESERGGRIPALALTTLARTDEGARRLLSDVKRDLPKPVEPEMLTAEIARMTGRERRRAQR